MIALDAYQRSLDGTQPPAELTAAQQALWWVRKRDWARAHDCAQAVEGDAAADWVHAHLHRVEGDMENATHWYGRAGKPVETGPIDGEWHSIASALTAAP